MIRLAVTDNAAELAQLEEARLITSHDAMSASFDNTLVLLAGGSLTLSISFVRDIAKHPVALWAIQGSWVAMAVALTLILCTFQASVYVHKRIIRAHREKTAYDDLPWRVRNGVSVLNAVASIFFLVGAALLIYFAVINA